MTTRRLPSLPKSPPAQPNGASSTPPSPKTKPKRNTLTSPDALQAAAVRLSLRFPEDRREALSSRLRDIAAEVQIASRSGQIVTDEERAGYLLGIACGLSALDAGKLAGRDWRSFANLANVDAGFRRECDAAMDTSVAEIDERLRTIGLTGDPASMATVRALEVLRRGRSRTERRDLQLTMRTTDEEGRPREITVRALAPTAD